MHTHTHTPILCACHTQTHTHAHAHIHTHTHTHTHTHAHVTHTCNTHTSTHTNSHTRTQSHARTHTHTPTHIHTYTHKCDCAHTQEWTEEYIKTHTMEIVAAAGLAGTTDGATVAVRALALNVALTALVIVALTALAVDWAGRLTAVGGAAAAPAAHRHTELIPIVDFSHGTGALCGGIADVDVQGPAPSSLFDIFNRNIGKRTPQARELSGPIGGPGALCGN
jgi:hypothetical protein